MERKGSNVPTDGRGTRSVPLPAASVVAAVLSLLIDMCVCGEILSWMWTFGPQKGGSKGSPCFFFFFLVRESPASCHTSWSFMCAAVNSNMKVKGRLNDDSGSGGRRLRKQKSDTGYADTHRTRDPGCYLTASPLPSDREQMVIASHSFIAPSFLRNRRSDCPALRSSITFAPRHILPFIYSFTSASVSLHFDARRSAVERVHPTLA